jgi:hypothetical protein
MDYIIKAINIYLQQNKVDAPLTLSRLRHILHGARELEKQDEIKNLKAQRDALDACQEF